MTEQARFPRSILGQVFPEGFVAGTIEEESTVPDIVEALRIAGVQPDGIRLLPGSWAVEIDASHHPALAAGKPLRGEVEASQEFLAAAFLGDLVVGIEAPSEERARELGVVLTRAGVRCVHHFGERTVTVLRETAGSPA